MVILVGMAYFYTSVFRGARSAAASGGLFTETIRFRQTCCSFIMPNSGSWWPTQGGGGLPDANTARFDKRKHA